MKRYLPFAIILVVFLVAAGAGALLFHFHQPPPPPPAPSTPAFGRPAAEPPHVRGAANAPVELEEFGDFECMPCYRLWPAMKNIEKDYAKSVSITFREHPLPQHRHARVAARAAEAAGLQGRFWEMHDLLYLKRSDWVDTQEVRAFFNTCATELGLDLDRFTKDMDGDEVARRIAADEDRGASLGIDRTPFVFINGKKVEFTPNPEDGLRAEIDAALGPIAP
jgi:protein-disulfide isomerase